MNRNKELLETHMQEKPSEQNVVDLEKAFDGSFDHMISTIRKHFVLRTVIKFYMKDNMSCLTQSKP